jgi:diaminopimelate epimerase
MSDFAPTRKMILETRSKVTLVEPLGEVNVIATIDIPNFYKDPELELALEKLIGMPFSLIDVGNLHLCIEVDDFDNFDNFELEEFYRQLESTIKPHKINVSIYKKSDTDIRIATYENGVGMTLSCGSASASVAFLNIKKGLALDIYSDGGSLNFLAANDKLIMQGPTELSFNGVINE